MTVTNEDSSDDVRRLRRKLAREIKAREQAEQLLEEKSEELYTLGRRVQDLALNLQTAERDAAVASLGQAIAHDLNNLIAAISGYAMLLKPDLDEQTQAYQRAERIGRAAEQAAAVVGSLDQLTTQTVELKPIDLSELIETNVQIAEGLRPDHIYLRIDVAPHLHLVGDSISISRCLINIIKNAFEATGDRGVVTIKATTDYDISVNDYANALALGEPADHYSALIQIIDSGQGMDMHTLESAFDRTFSTKHSAGIHGLGLQSVKALIDQNLAFVRVESELGKGSCFSLYMKSPDLIPRDVETSPPVLATHSSGHIFIIDDDPYVGDMLQATLTNLGYDALWYEFPLRALKDLHETPPALIITDFNMPDMSGKEFATQAREILPTVPIVVYSGQAASITPSLLYSAILKKPVKADALDKVIKSLIKS